MERLPSARRQVLVARAGLTLMAVVSAALPLAGCGVDVLRVQSFIPSPGYGGALVDPRSDVHIRDWARGFVPKRMFTGGC